MDFSTVLLYLVVFFVLIYFLMIRPQQVQQKKRKEMLEQLNVNDRVVTLGGIHGKITKIDEDELTLKVADKVEIKIDKAAVGRVEEE